MAGGKETPRQKMIGMMYLVLTALLALNVQKEVLNAFVVMNHSLETTNVNLEAKNRLAFGNFEQKMASEPAKTQKWYDKAVEVRRQSKELYNYIQEMKAQVMMETEGLEMIEVLLGQDEWEFHQVKELGECEAIDNYDQPTYTLGLSEPSAATTMDHGYDALTLKAKLEEYRQALLELIPENAQDNAVYGSILNTFTLRDTVEEGTAVSWETNQFYHMPMAAVVSNLSRLQTDIRNAEADLIGYLYSNVDATSVKFTHVSPAVIAPSNYILTGDTFRAEVFMAGFDSTQNPKMTFAPNYLDSSENGVTFGADTLTSEQLLIADGKGQIRIPATSEGLQTVKGNIKMRTPDGKGWMEYPVSYSYLVARPSLTVSPTKMNVLYKGIDNPISVSVPGIPQEKLRVSITGGNSLSRSGEGYVARMSTSSPREVKVRVSAEMDDGSSRAMGEMTFRVKNLPKPQATIASKVGGKVKKKDLCAAQGVRISYGSGFAFDLTAKLVSYKYSVKKGSVITPEKLMRNARFPTELKDIICGMRTGDKLYIDNIKAKGEDGVIHDLGGIILTIQ